MENTRNLLIAQMKRAIDLLEVVSLDFRDDWTWDRERAELKNKLHEIRRDSIRLGKRL